MEYRCHYDKLLEINHKYLRPHPKNRNTHTHAQIQRLAEILKFQGWRYPVKISNQTGYIISGHGRLMAAKELGCMVPVVFQDYTDDAMEYADLIADNAIAEWAQLDLAGINDDIGDLGPDFDIDVLGINGFEIDVSDRNGDEKDDDIPDNIPAKTKLGQIYQLGNHRLMCGDATKDIDALLDGTVIQVCITDPPYGINFKYTGYDDSPDNWYKLINSVMPILKANSKFLIMPCCRITSLDWWYINHKPDWIMCWYKGSPGHRSKIGFNDWEPHLVWGKPQKQMHDYWQTRCGFDVDGHPCPKPVEYSQWLIERSVKENDNVMDVFGGSGSTLIACEKTKRNCYMMELEPKYCDVIIKRWEDYTGQEAVKI